MLYITYSVIGERVGVIRGVRPPLQKSLIRTFFLVTLGPKRDKA
jgi:hypothetical protein